MSYNGCYNRLLPQVLALADGGADTDAILAGLVNLPITGDAEIPWLPPRGTVIRILKKEGYEYWHGKNRWLKMARGRKTAPDKVTQICALWHHATPESIYAETEAAYNRAVW